MPSFPIQTGDAQGIVEGLNYTLSGPSGLGQNFIGFSSSSPAFITGNYRPPFTKTPTFGGSPANIYVAPIALGTSSMLDGRTWKFEFASAQATPPFALGNAIYVNGVTDSFYDGSYSPIGVTECTTTYVVARTNGTYDIVAPSTGGTVSFNGLTTGSGAPIFVSTDCNAKLSVNSATARVFVSGQLPLVMQYTCTETSVIQLSVALNRYRGRPNNDAVNPDYVFDLEQTLAQRDYFLQADAGSGTIPNSIPGTWLVGYQPIETIFSNVIDNPGLGYYWYIMEIMITPVSGNMQVFEIDTGIGSGILVPRGLTAQLVKE
jgi:hypothetical protein